MSHPRWIKHKRKSKRESLFLIPAQRVLTMRDGWPRPFSDYTAGDPFAVREFSEKLRILVEQEFGSVESLFPQERRLKREFRQMLERTVFARFRLQIDKVRAQKRLVLGAERIRFRSWSGRPVNVSLCPCSLGFTGLCHLQKCHDEDGSNG